VLAFDRLPKNALAAATSRLALSLHDRSTAWANRFQRQPSGR